MDLSTTLSVVQTILGVIQTMDQMQSMCYISDCKRELEDLQSTIETIKAVLEDADARQDGLNNQEKNFIKELKDAVYDADDVLDEYFTIAKQKQVSDNGDRFSDKVRSFFCRFNLLTHNLSYKVKMVNRKLDAIAKKSKFSFKVECKPIKFKKDETSSFLCDQIIGRDEDVEKIVGMLLGCDNVDRRDVSLLAIVGMGGLGKTALAQLVYNDPRINEAFELKSWTCIADQDQQHWNLTGFLGKVVKCSPIHNLTSLEEMHHEVKEKLGGKKYLLVLDDVWTESYDKWLQFEGYLKMGQRGSWIIVTTRSNITAQMIGGDQVHELRGLSEMESWNLFERMAFQGEERDSNLVNLGEEIVKKCTNVPLAIRVVGSSLRGQPKSKWESLANISVSNDAIKMTTILKLSYHQLDSSLKTCFAYCAIFPKDWEISKQMLIRLWMAQGYINTESLGEEYFLILLQRCFFQDIHEDEFGEVKWFKMHDLLHDIAEQVAGEEICKLNSDIFNVGKRVRHISLLNDCYTQHIFNNTSIRTYLRVKDIYMNNADQLIASNLVLKWACLRSLDLRNMQAKSLPESIGQLLHLRCLDLSWSYNLEILPKSLTKLVNLQTLDLCHCDSLTQLPNDMSKLVDLSTLNVAKCDALSLMPARIGMLTRLHTLGQFVVGARARSSSRQCFDGLEDLKHLKELKGGLVIHIRLPGNAKFVKEQHGGGAYLRSKERLRKITIKFKRGNYHGSKEYEQALLEEMQPHHDLRKLKLVGYHGETMPRWPRRGDNSALFDLPNLVSLKIYNCRELLSLPLQIAKLPHLKQLVLVELRNVVYVVDMDPRMAGSGEGLSFFPSLDELNVIKLPVLKGLWRRSESVLHVVNPDSGGSSQEPHLEWVSFLCFPQLTSLLINHCLNMTYIPVCPRLVHLVISDPGRKLFLNYMRCTPRHHPSSSSSSSSSYSKPKILTINNFEWLKSMPAEYIRFCAAIEIAGEKRVESLGEVRELLHTNFLSCLRFLRMERCLKLKSVGEWFKHLSSLERLDIYSCANLNLNGLPWQHLPGSLESLCLDNFKNVEELPEGIQYCTSLQSLAIWHFPKLESLPKWIPKLTSLRKMQLRFCSEKLKERCEKTNGQDWPLIAHIPLTCVRSESDEFLDQMPSSDVWTNEDDWHLELRPTRIQ